MGKFSLEYIIAGYCFGFFFMGFGFGMAVGNIDAGWYVVIFGNVILWIMFWLPKTNPRTLRKYRLTESIQ